MEPMPVQQAALRQLTAVPGVVGSMVFDPAGAVVAEFPPVFDVAGLRQLAAQLSSDGYFQEWLSGEQASLDLRFGDGHAIVHAVDGSWLLVLCTAEVNAQLLSMSLTQVVRRLHLGGKGAGELAGPPSRLDRLRAIATAELGDHADQALEILAAAPSTPKGLLRATEDVEKLTRLFISKKRAEEIGRRMRDVLSEPS